MVHCVHAQFHIWIWLTIISLKTWTLILEGFYFGVSDVEAFMFELNRAAFFIGTQKLLEVSTCVGTQGGSPNSRSFNMLTALRNGNRNALRSIYIVHDLYVFGRHLKLFLSFINKPLKQ